MIYEIFLINNKGEEIKIQKKDDVTEAFKYIDKLKNFFNITFGTHPCACLDTSGER